SAQLCQPHQRRNVFSCTTAADHVTANGLRGIAALQVANHAQRIKQVYCLLRWRGRQGDFSLLMVRNSSELLAGARVDSSVVSHIECVQVKAKGIDLSQKRIK